MAAWKAWGTCSLTRFLDQKPALFCVAGTSTPVQAAGLNFICATRAFSASASLVFRSRSSRSVMACAISCFCSLRRLRTSASRRASSVAATAVRRRFSERASSSSRRARFRRFSSALRSDLFIRSMLVRFTTWSFTRVVDASPEAAAADDVAAAAPLASRFATAATAAASEEAETVMDADDDFFDSALLELADATPATAAPRSFSAEDSDLLCDDDTLLGLTVVGSRSPPCFRCSRFFWSYRRSRSFRNKSRRRIFSMTSSVTSPHKSSTIASICLAAA